MRRNHFRKQDHWQKIHLHTSPLSWLNSGNFDQLNNLTNDVKINQLNDLNKVDLIVKKTK